MQDATNVDDLFAQFSARLATAGGIAHRATSVEDAVGTIAELLERAVTQGPELQDVVAWVSSQLVSHQPALVAALEARGLTVRVAEDPATVRDQPLGIALARIAIAETGSVLLHEREIADRSVSLMTNVLVAICPLDALRLSLDDAAPVLREISTAHGSYATLVTGPSRTADIERQLTVGVQGPGEMHVVFLPDAVTP
jgi:L-lactate dehydrogenase complex protein LldG